MLNIPSTVNDPNYRYRMPKMQLKIESKGNGIKTNIINLADVAKHVRTNQMYILKFFGFEKASQIQQKASQTKSNKQVKGNTSYIIMGSFTEEQLLKTLDKFIEKYVLCPKCKLPEINLLVVKDKIHGKCNSCPFSGEFDNHHRIVGYMLKNPPTEKQQETKAQQKINKDLKEQGKLNQKSKVVKEQSEEEEESASQLFSAETLEFGSEELSKLIEYTKKFIEKRKKEDFDIASAETVAELKPLGLKKPLYAYVLFNAFFTINIHKQVQENGGMYMNLMKKLVILNVEVETLLNLQYLFLEVYKEKDFSKNISGILMKLYENKIFKDEFVKDWNENNIADIEKLYLYNEARNEKFKEMAADFIECVLGEEDEDDEDD